MRTSTSIRACGVVIIAGLLAACSSSGSGSSGTAAGTPASSSSSSAAYQQAVSLTQQAETRPTSLTVPSLPAKPPSGKTLDFMVCGVPACLDMAALAKSAVEAAGWKFVPIQQGLSQQAWVSAYQQAVLNHPDAVIGTGIGALSLIGHELQQLKTEGVPVVEVSAPATPAEPGVIGVTNSTPQTEQFGRELAEWVLADSHAANAHVLYVDIPDQPVYVAQESTFTQVLTAGCSSCSVSTLIQPGTSLDNGMATAISSYLLSHPDINYVFGAFTDILDGLPAALQSNGTVSKVKLITDDTQSTEDEYLLHGQEAATAAVPWAESLWGAFNLILTDVEKAPLGPAQNIAYPNMIFTGKTLITTSAMPPLVANYEEIFKTAWHLG
jgi:ABC-type sugar transport system substrate-binding protein